MNIESIEIKKQDAPQEDPRFNNLKMVIYPSKYLSTISLDATPEDFNSGYVQGLVNKMKDVMKRLRGAGLSAIQVSIPIRVFVIDNKFAGETSGKTVFVNPYLISKDGQVSGQEGCLSFPNLSIDVARSEKIRIGAQDESGLHFNLDLEGFGAIIFQHELDHLNGKTFLDDLSRLKRNIYERKFAKTQKQAKFTKRK